VEDEASLLLDLGKLRDAERLLKGLLAADRNCLAAHFHLARLYRRTAHYGLALRHARRTLRLNPNERNAHLNLGVIYDEMGRDKLASSHYRKDLHHNPDSAETLWNLG
jgi:Flp pilus assembly protein TadD